MAVVKGTGVGRRNLTWAEREFLSLTQASTPDGPIHSLDQLPDAFWEAIALATDYYVLEVTRPPSYEDANGWRNLWKKWEKQFIWHTGIGPLKDHPWNEYLLLVREGRTSSQNLPDEFVDFTGQKASPALRLSALEFLLDITDPHPDFEHELNGRFVFLNAGLRIVGRRFVPFTSRPLHENIVEPAVALLNVEAFAPAETLFNEATNRARSGDYPGCVTACWRSTEEALKCLGSSLEDLGNKARANQGITPAVGDLINKLQALRYESEVSSAGPIDLHTAMLAMHVSGSLIIYLSNRLRPFLEYSDGPDY
jgi:hypothetical protein